MAGQRRWFVHVRRQVSCGEARKATTATQSFQQTGCIMHAVAFIMPVGNAVYIPAVYDHAHVCVPLHAHVYTCKPTCVLARARVCLCVGWDIFVVYACR